MYRLMIVDDECMITDLLGEYMERHLEGEVEIIKAYTATRAREVIGSSTVHILLTDINIPGMNGLELHRFAMETNPNCKVIF